MKKKIDLLDEKSDFSKEILEKTPSWIITWGNSIFFIFIIILFCLSWIIKYPDVVSAEVEITSENPPIYLIAKSNGKLNELDIKDGSSIRKGDWIAIIENSANTNDIKRIDSILNNTSTSSFSLPPNLKLGELQSFYNELIKNVNQYKYFKKFNPQMAGMSSNQDRINKVSNIQGNFNNQKEIAFKEYEVKKKDFDRNQELLNQGVISKSEFEKSQIELLQTENKYKSFNSNISILESDKSIIRKDNVDLNLQKENQKI